MIETSHHVALQWICVYLLCYGGPRQFVHFHTMFETCLSISLSSIVLCLRFSKPHGMSGCNSKILIIYTICAWKCAIITFTSNGEAKYTEIGMTMTMRAKMTIQHPAECKYYVMIAYHKQHLQSTDGILIANITFTSMYEYRYANCHTKLINRLFESMPSTPNQLYSSIRSFLV